MTVEDLTLPIAALKADPDNARQISDEALTGLGISVEEFGDLSGIVWNERTGELVCGHQRVTALRRAGVTEWHREVGAGDRAWLHHPATGDRFPIRIVDWDPVRQRMANLVANNPGIAGEFTPAALDQLKALEDEAAFESLRLGELEKQLGAEMAALAQATPKDGLTDPDSVPETPAEPVTRPGDLWLLGEHRLLCGDSTKPEDVARVMGGEKAAVLATDPPYGVDYTEVKRNIAPGTGRQFKDWGDIAGDDLGEDGLAALLDGFLAASLPHCRDVAVYCWHPPGPLSEVFWRALARANVVLSRTVLWVKPYAVLGRGDYHYQHEPCFYGWVDGHRPPWLGDRKQSTVWEATQPGDPYGQGEKRMHPTQKPVALFETPMQNHTQAGEVCLDPFAGSGTTVIAAERLGRRCFAMELSPAYCDVIVARWEAFTGKKAVRATPSDRPPSNQAATASHSPP